MAGLAPRLGLHLPHTVSASRLTSAADSGGAICTLIRRGRMQSFREQLTLPFHIWGIRARQR